MALDAEHDRMVRWIHVQPDDVPHFVDQQRVGRQLEAFRAMRLQPKRSPDGIEKGLPVWLKGGATQRLLPHMKGH